MLTLLLTILLSAPIHDARAEDLAYLVSLETGEPEALIRVVMLRESSKKPDSVLYCTRWEEVPDGPNKGRLICRKWTTCHGGCRRKPHVWRNRLDVGLFGLRDVPYRVNGKRTVGTSQPRRFGVSSECALDPLCSALLASAVIRRLKALPPKRCNLKGVPDSVGSWLTYYAAGMGKTTGCRSRRERLNQAGLTRKGE